MRADLHYIQSRGLPDTCDRCGQVTQVADVVSRTTDQPITTLCLDVCLNEEGWL